MSKDNLGTESYRWDLSVFYSGIDDPQIDKDLEILTERYRKFNETYKNKLAEKLGPALLDVEEIDMLAAKLNYIGLQQSLNVADPVVKAKSADVDRKLSDIYGEYMTFFDLEMVALDQAILDQLYETDPTVKKFKPYIEYSRGFKNHYLSEPVESALTKRSLFGPGSWSEFFDEFEADLEIEYKGEKKTFEEALNILTESKDPEERAAMLKQVDQVMAGPFGKYSAQTLYMKTGSTALEVKDRKYSHPMASRNKSNRIPDEAVEVLHKAVTEVAAPLSQRYYRLKAAHLGMKTLKWSDRNALLPFHDDTKISFDKALEIVLTAYRSFSSTLAGIVETMIEHRRLDVPPVKGKRSGAFCSSVVLPGRKTASFVFMNYFGSRYDVMTLAPELGHAVHFPLAGEAQGPLMYSAPMAYAETASVFGEATTFNFLKQQLIEQGDKKALLALISGTIEDTINTVVRQISFSNFERRIHGMDPSYTTWSEPKKHSIKELDKIWLEVTREFYGNDGDVFTYENAEHLWAYISHFHSPFYVYAYAFGQLLSHSLYAQKDKFGDQFEPLYLDLLRAGGTKDAIELLKPFGLDPTNEQFWIDGINVGLGKLVAEMEELSAEMGISVK